MPDKKLSILKKKRVKDIYELLKQGKSTDFIYELYMSDEMGGFSHGTIRNDLVSAHKLLDAWVDKDQAQIIGLHKNRYENIYGEAMRSLESVMNLDDRDVLNKIGPVKFSEAITALQGKERLAGLHNKKVSVNIQNNTVVLGEGDVSLERFSDEDFEDLTLEEMIMMRDMLQKGQKEPVEGVFPVKIKGKLQVTDLLEDDFDDDQDIEMPDTVVEDIDYVDVSENIEKDKVDVLKEEVGKKMEDVREKLVQSDMDLFKKAIDRRKTQHIRNVSK